MLTWALIAISLALLYWVFSKPSGLPPGRWGLPIIGYIPLYTKDIGRIISDFRQSYGDIFTWKVGGQVLVGLCDYKLIKSTFNRPECQGRPYLYTFDIGKFHTNTGILSSVGTAWSQGRRFALRHLKDFGMGKSSMESVIQHEAVSLTKSFESTAGKPIELSWNLNVAVLNVIWKLIANQRYEIDDEEIIKFNEMVNDNIDKIQGKCIPLDLFPGLHKILPKFVLNWMGVDMLYANMDKFKGLFWNIIKMHEKTFDPDHPMDYIDAYLKEIQNERGNIDTIFKEDYQNLVTTIGDLFATGSETTSSTMRWLVALMATHPEIQKKMQEEIDEAVPRDQIPSLQDKEKCPYTEAVLFEVLRYSSLLPMGVLHATTEDIQIEGYHVPKNTAMFASAKSCHRNPKYFQRPNEFYPEHFLDDEGKVLSKKEGFLPFSIGRRQCLGESLAKMELFLFVTCLFQNLSAAPPKGVTIHTVANPSQLLFNYIEPYKVVFTKRK